jgi:hypothetical protein
MLTWTRYLDGHWTSVPSGKLMVRDEVVHSDRINASNTRSITVKIEGNMLSLQTTLKTDVVEKINLYIIYFQSALLSIEFCQQSKSQFFILKMRSCKNVTLLRHLIDRDIIVSVKVKRRLFFALKNCKFKVIFLNNCMNTLSLQFR